jgi:hypothetical protein
MPDGEPPPGPLPGYPQTHTHKGDHGPPAAQGANWSHYLDQKPDPFPLCRATRNGISGPDGGNAGLPPALDGATDAATRPFRDLPC